MHIVRLKISGFRGIHSGDITLGRHSVLVGPNNSGKSTIIEALALLFGRDRLERRLTEHDFHGSAPNENSRILCIATVTGFLQNDPQHHPAWFSPDRGVEKWLDPNVKALNATHDAQHTDLAVQIDFAARFDLDELVGLSVTCEGEPGSLLPLSQVRRRRLLHLRLARRRGHHTC